MSDNRIESRLLAQAKEGDLSAFWQLVEKHGPMIRRLLRRLVGHRERADDLFSETFLRAADRIGQFKGESKFSTWLTAIAVNLAKNEMKREGRLQSLSWDELLPASAHNHGDAAAPLATWVDPLKLLERKELADLLDRALRQLPPKYRTVFALRDVEGLSTEETARALGLSITAVKSRAVRARLALRNFLTPYLTGEAAIRA